MGTSLTIKADDKVGKATDTVVEQGVYEVQVADEKDRIITMANCFTISRAQLTTSASEIEIPTCYLLHFQKELICRSRLVIVQRITKEVYYGNE